MKTVADFVIGHPLFAGLASDKADFIAGCGKLRRFPAGDFLARENDAADYFYLLLEGRVAIETHLPNRPASTFLTLNPGDVVGWSWLLPPYRWQFDARAISDLRTIELDGRCLRDKCETDTELGFQLLRRLTTTLVARIHCARLQLLDFYGNGQNGGSTPR